MPTPDPAPAAADELMQQADAAHHAGDTVLAAALYQRVLSLWPDSRPAALAAERLLAFGTGLRVPPPAAEHPAALAADEAYLPGELAATCLRATALASLIVLSLLAGWLLVDAAVGRAAAMGRSWIPGILALLGAVILPALLATVAGIGLNLVALRRRLERPQAR